MSDVEWALRSLLRVLEQLKLPYSVIGGMAVRAYGIPRPTYDLDVCVALSRSEIELFFQAAERVGFVVPEIYRKGWTDSVADMPLVKLRFHHDGREVDADLFLAETPFLKSIVDRRCQLATPDATMWLASPEDIILLKLVAGRHRDLSDVADILFTQGQLDQSYLRYWAARLNVSDRLEQCLLDSQF